MSEIKLTTPEGYFEKSLGRTLSSISKLERKRKAIAGGFAAIVAAAGIFYAAVQTNQSALEKEYYAMEVEMAPLDIFLEINR